MAFILPLCLFNRHEPDRSRAEWDGKHFVSTCVHCGQRVRRAGRGKWKKDWMQDG